MATAVPNIPDEFSIRRHDRYPWYEIDVYDLCGNAEDLSVATDIVFTMQARDGTLKVNRDQALAVLGPDGSTFNRLQYRWKDVDVDTPGKYTAEFEATFSDGRKRTFPSDPIQQALRIRVHDDLDNT